MCLFLPELLWVAFRRRAAERGFSALHLVRLALEAYEPEWRGSSLVSGFADGALYSSRIYGPGGSMPRQLRYGRRVEGLAEDDAEGFSLLVEGKDIGEVAAEASRGISARSRAIEVWGLRASVVEVERRLNRSQVRGQFSMFSARELVGL